MAMASGVEQDRRGRRRIHGRPRESPVVTSSFNLLIDDPA